MGVYLLRSALFTLALYTVFLPSLAFSEKSTSSDAILTFWNVGQGDFISVINKRECLFFDVGGSSRLSEKTLSYIKTACIGKPGKLFISHFDLDHIRNARQLLKTVTIQKAFFSHLDPKTKYAKSLLTDLSFAKVEILQIDSRFFLKENGFSLKCLWPESGFDHYRIENDHSLVLLLKVNGRSVLFTGDLPERIEPFLQNTNIEILKVGHHGSKTSSSLAFLKNLRPKVCVVSVGAENHYGHPTHEALTRFKQTHCAILRTDRLGSVSFEL